jgi:hypothetical protein
MQEAHLTLVKCSECGADISSSASVCPQCGKPKAPRQGGLEAAAGVLVLIGLGWWFFGGGSTSSLRGIQNKVATDAVAEYNIAAAQGNNMQKCVQAGLVAAAYLQAQDSTNYNTWKATETADCAVAGLPH